MRRLIWLISALVFLAGGPLCAAQAAAWQAAVTDVAKSAPDAEIVVVDLASGHVAASRRLIEAGRTLAQPGSTLKPIALYELLEQGKWNPERRIACSRQLHVAGKELNCSHPEIPALDAREALTWSCNTYFAAVAGSVSPAELRGLLERSGLLGATGLAGSEAVAQFREPRTTDEAKLALLGVEGIEVTPLELVRAYRWLGLKFAAHPETKATEIVSAGIRDSASFGMAGAAGLGGVTVEGKTGTASATAGGRTHGWFVGLAPAQNPKVAVVVYLPVGRGADAAGVAGEVLKRSPLRAR
ncbi:penicillin-binding transpeptidase domain-containing protein [Terracidiphilus gabretensis]|uniref:penicillin-binding transpeptidase domain-containing protein n=1 Tax=Terracidiphilus gabretensis TaxID=1577687 RepID=UPI0018D2088C|nr:penicillin-binding transpeptidase domain-containing protein [Terracidiphilus gabretensis]